VLLQRFNAILLHDSFIDEEAGLAVQLNFSLCNRPNFCHPSLIMAALRSRCGHYIFALWFLSIFFYSSPNLSGRTLDVCHTSTHDVALVRI